MDEHLINWSTETLNRLGFEIQGSALPIKNVPWSSIYVFQTPQGKIYLKQARAPFHLESHIIHQFRQLNYHHIPTLISKNDDYHAFLMRDDGFPLRAQLKKSYHPQYAIEALTTYQCIQADSATQREEFLKLGIPDWRIPRIPFLLKMLLESKDLLIADGLTFEEIDALTHMLGYIEEICHQIHQFPIPSTLEHGDFHDNNILIKDRKLTIIDWGDSIISHPFFSLASFIWSAKRNHSLPRDICQFIENDYLKLWCKYVHQSEIKKIYNLIKIINPIKFSLGFSRISNCFEHQGMRDYKGHIASALRYFLLHQQTQ
jgi:hypothetical protein